MKKIERFMNKPMTFKDVIMYFEVVPCIVGFVTYGVARLYQKMQVSKMQGEVKGKEGVAE